LLNIYWRSAHAYKIFTLNPHCYKNHKIWFELAVLKIWKIFGRVNWKVSFF